VFACLEVTNWPHTGCKVLASSELAMKGKSTNEGDYKVYFRGLSKLLVDSGWLPDLIILHAGWDSHNIARYFPKVKVIAFCEWWFNETNIQYHSRNQVPFSPNINKSITEALETASCLISPTEWQKSQFPSDYRSRIRVIRDGFPSDLFQRRRRSTGVKSRKPKLLFISRGLEYTRGADRLAELIKNVPTDCYESLSIVAADRWVYDYYKQSTPWKVFLECFNNELPGKVSLTSTTNYNEYLDAVSNHDYQLYLSRPFVLSWSTIESLLTGSRILFIDNPSLLEFANSSLLGFNNIASLCKFIRTDTHSNSMLNDDPGSWLDTPEGTHFRYKSSLACQINKLSSLIF